MFGARGFGNHVRGRVFQTPNLSSGFSQFRPPTHYNVFNNPPPFRSRLFRPSLASFVHLNSPPKRPQSPASPTTQKQADQNTIELEKTSSPKPETVGILSDSSEIQAETVDSQPEQLNDKKETALVLHPSQANDLDNKYYIIILERRFLFSI